MLGRKVFVPKGYAERECVLVEYWLPGLPNCYVLCHERSEGHLSVQERAELLQFFYIQAQHLALAATNDPEAFLLIHSGVSLSKRPNFHFHVFVIRSRWQKALAYSYLGAKNLSQVCELGVKAMFSKQTRQTKKV